MPSTAAMSMGMSVALPPASPKRTPPPRREKVLIVLHADGWVEAYADKNVDVRIVQRLHTEHADADLVDQYLEATVPKFYRQLYVPINLRAQDQCRVITPEMEVAKHYDLHVLRSLKEVQG